MDSADASGRAGLRKKLRRDQVLAFFSQLRPCVVAIDTYGGAHFWGREIGKLDYEVRLIPPAYVKPFVKRQKNDAAYAEAFCEAAQRPTRCFVPVKSEKTQGAAMVFRVRELLIPQRTQAINALRGHPPLSYGDHQPTSHRDHSHPQKRAAVERGLPSNSGPEQNPASHPALWLGVLKAMDRLPRP